MKQKGSAFYRLLKYSNQNLWNDDCFLVAMGIQVPSVRVNSE